MPAMKDELGATEVVELVSLIRDFRDGRRVVPHDPEDEDHPLIPSQPAEPKPLTSSGARTHRPTALAATDLANPRADEARKLYRRFCMSCHGADGHGTTLPHRFHGFRISHRRCGTSSEPTPN